MTFPFEVNMPKAKRPISINHGREQIRRLTALRTEHRDARQYAEAWYRSLRDWAVQYPVDVLPKMSYAHFRDGWQPLTTGECGPAQKTFIRTPVGEIGEVEIGQHITAMAKSAIPETVQLGRMLDRLRRHDSACMESLLRGTAWSQNRERAVWYAMSVLTLAVRLGDVQAERPLMLVRAELSPLEVVKSV